MSEGQRKTTGTLEAHALVMNATKFGLIKNYLTKERFSALDVMLGGALLGILRLFGWHV